MSTPAFGDRKRTWQQIAEEASREKDPEKLLRLTRELGLALNKELTRKGSTDVRTPSP